MNTSIGQYRITAKLYESKFTLVCRGYRVLDRLSVILKVLRPETVTQERLTSFKREFEILSKLGLPGVVKVLALEGYNNSLMMVLEDIGADSLSHILKQTPLSLTDSIEIMIALVDTVGLIHKEHIIHKDINPSNIIYDPTAKRVNLIDFGIADETPERSMAPQPPLALEGTLEYISPEQTGRMNRQVDYRTDFYSLGVTFYKMLTGKLPFEAEDALGMVYSHIAKTPIPPHEINPDIPEMVSRIVLKMMAKMADGRYQSAWGLKADLEKCINELKCEGTIHPFELGLEDYSDRLRMPHKLYGRQKEIDQLLEAFDRVARGGRELLLVAGYAGVGKTALVREIYRPIATKQGFFVEGKFDQLERNVPYFAWIQTFEELVNYILMANETELAKWKQNILKAVGSIGRVLTDVIPNLELVIGSQPEVPSLGITETQNRFNYVFLKFIKAIATKEHPLVIFLDDLQWVDAASLNLLETLVTSPEVSNILVIGAYRDNEVDALHPLTKAIEAMQKEEAKIVLMTLGSISEQTVNELIADMLHHESFETAPLAHLIYSKTGGNPFFLLQTLKTLAEKQVITFDIKSRSWKWDIATLKSIEITDNVVTLMLGRIQQLLIETQYVLSLAACIGYRFDIKTLSVIAEQPEDVTMDRLQTAKREGLIISVGEDYLFVHDRIQQAAYTLISHNDRPAKHLKIGWLLLANTPEDKLAENIFEIVSQLNRGAVLISAQEERVKLAGLNLIAGKRAKASTAYATALSYLTAGATLLAEDSWENRHDLVFSLEINRAECEFLTGEQSASEQRLVELSGHAANTVEQSAVACLRMDLYTTLGQSSRAVAAGLEFLGNLGINWQPHPSEKEVQREYERLQATLGNRDIEELIDLPLMSDPALLASMEVLTKLGPAALFTDANLSCLTVSRAVNLSLENGNSDGACVAYTRFGMYAGPRFGNWEVGFRLGQIGYELVEQRGLKRFQARAYVDYAIFILTWEKYIGSARDILSRAIDVANKSGELTYVAFGYNNLISNLIVEGDPLVEVQTYADNGIEFTREARFGLVFAIITSQLGLIRTLRGLTRKFGSFDDEQFDELKFEQHLSSNPALAVAECWHWIRKLQACFFAGDYTAAVEAANKAQQLLWTSTGFLETADYHFYAALAKAAILDSVAPRQRRQYLEDLAGHHKQLEIWAEHCPENFANRSALVGAEVARIEHRDQNAIGLYAQAIVSAYENGFVQNEAVANETAAEFYRKRGFEKFSRTHLSEAASCYSRWGAMGKVNDLEERYPYLVRAKPREEMVGTTQELLDISTIMKATQTISSEIELDKLLDEVIRIVIENAGAQSGFLLFEQDGVWQIAAKGGIGVAELEIDLPVGLDESDLVARSVIRFVARTKENVVLDDAANRGEFVSDPHIMHEKTKSLLCAPLLSRGRLIGILYLENNLATRAFSPERVQLLEILISQATISLENARIYEALRDSEELNRFTLGNIIDAVFVTDDVGSFIYICPNVYVIFGYSFEEVQSIGNIDYLLGKALFSPTELEASKRLTNIEREISDKFGRTHTLIVNVVSVDIKGGTRLYICRDITERKQAEEALQKSEDLLNATQRLAKIGGWEWDVEHQTTFWTEETYRIHGFEPKAYVQESSEYIDRSLACYDPEDRPIVLAAFQRCARQGEPYDLELPFTSADGRRKWIRTTGTAMREDSRIVKVIGNIMDITERKQAEDALRKSEAEYRRIVDTANEGIWVLGPENMTTFVNKRMGEMLGYKTEEMLGRPFTDFMFEEDVAGHLQKMKNRRKGISETYERRFHRKDGQTIWTYAAATPIFDSKHRFQGSFAMFTDITEHKLFEQRQRDFYRRTILAATEGKLQLTEREEIERIAGPPVAMFKADSAEDFNSIRIAVYDYARSIEIDELRAADYRVAVGEAVTNATKHAGGGTVSIHVLSEAILTVVSDSGPGIEAMSIPEVALKKGYTTAGTLGMGYKVMISIADKVYLATGSWGTTVGVEMSIKSTETIPNINAMYHAL